jgi:DNA-binding MarR family transcriptional regulator
MYTYIFKGLVMTFDYETKIPHWINRLSFMLRSELQHRIKAEGHDLTAEEWALLMVLWRDGAMTMGKLASITLRDRTTVTRVVDRLVTKGLLQRSSEEGDRRQVVIQVTPLGHQIQPSVAGAVVPLVEKAGQGIAGEELELALSVLKRMVDNLEEPDVRPVHEVAKDDR